MKKMNFEAFVKEVSERIREYLPDNLKGAHIELMTIVKSNDVKLTGLSIRAQDSTACPAIYLERFFEEYLAGEKLDSVLEKIAGIRINNDFNMPYTAEDITDFARVKSKIIPRLIGKAMNAAYLAERPYMGVANLAVTYHILLGDFRGSNASVAVTDKLAASWDVDATALHEIALDNLPRLLPSTFRPMSEALGASVPINDEALFVLSNTKSFFGASALLDQDMMWSIVNRFPEGFYILPSSIYEVLIVPATRDIALENMVRSVNASTVAPEERLSDSVYIYSVKDGLQVAR